MNALAILVEKAIIDNVSGSATLNLLQSQVSLSILSFLYFQFLIGIFAQDVPWQQKISQSQIDSERNLYCQIMHQKVSICSI